VLFARNEKSSLRTLVSGLRYKKYRAVSDTDSTHSAAQTRAQQGESAEMAAALFRMGLLAETADDGFPQLVLYISSLR
jgi:hypothetical protein